MSEAHLEQRRQQILDAAIVCFARKGFHETTMVDIAEEAGVSDGLAYRYFSGKEEIIETAVRERGGPAADDIPLRTEDGVEDLRMLLDLLLSSDIQRFEQPAEITATMGVRFRSWAEALHNEEIRSQLLNRWRHHFDVAEGLVVRGQEQGVISRQLDARAVARVMLACHYGLNLLGVLDPDIDLEKCKAVMLAMTFGEFHSG